MNSSHCWSCLVRPRTPRLIPSLPRVSVTPPFVRRNVVAKKKGIVAPKYRESKNARIINKRSEDRRPPVTPELKAARKRIVLSNTNALVIPGLQDLSEENMSDSLSTGQVLALPGPVIDQLRALNAFRLTQAWRAFRRPAVLLRKQNVEIGLAISRQSVDAKTVRKVITGDIGTGKSVVLLQSMAMAFLKGWVVISLLEPQELTSGTTSYNPIQGTEPIQYLQKQYTAKLLSQTLNANRSILASMTITSPLPDQFPTRLEQGTTLSQVAEIGANDPEVAWDFFNLLWQELTAPTAPGSEPRPPIMVAIDSLSFLMTETAYRSPDFKPIHAHDFVLANHFISLLSGVLPLGPSGGMVLAATSATSNPRANSLHFSLKQLLARQTRQSDLGHSTSVEFTGDSIPDPDPWQNHNPRILQVLTGHPDGVNKPVAKDQNIESRGVEVLRLEGLTREESRSLIEYFAKSGLVRDVVNESFVGNTWTLTGGGVVGELEKALLRLETTSAQTGVKSKRRKRRAM